MKSSALRLLSTATVLSLAAAIAPVASAQADVSGRTTLRAGDARGDTTPAIADVVDIRLVRGTSSINTVMRWAAPPVGNSTHITSQVFFSGRGPSEWRVYAEFVPAGGWRAAVDRKRDGRTVERCRVTALTTSRGSAVKVKIPLRCVNKVVPTQLSGQSLVENYHGRYLDRVS